MVSQIFARQTKIAITGPIFKSFAKMGPHYVDFTFAFDTTLLRLEMTEIWPKYVAQAGIVSSEPPWDRVNLLILFFYV